MFNVYRCIFYIFPIKRVLMYFLKCFPNVYYTYATFYGRILYNTDTQTHTQTQVR